MKRMALIAIVLCAVLVATAGAGVVIAKPQAPMSPLPGRVFQYDVTYQGKTIGALTVNTNTWTYIFDSRGLEPAKTYYLLSGEGKTIDAAKATAGGTVHMQGAWDPNTADLLAPQAPTFMLADAPLARAGNVVYFLTCYWSIQGVLNGLRVQGNFTARDMTTGAITHIPGTAEVYYCQEDGELRLAGTTHTHSPMPHFYDFDETFGQEINGAEAVKVIMHPDDPTIPQIWAYATTGPHADCQDPVLAMSWYTALLWTNVHGTLRAQDGTPLTNQPVYVYWWSLTKNYYVLWASDKTNSKGEYGVTKAFVKNFRDPYVYYPGGTVNGVPYCSATKPVVH